jgi:RNA polymerase sigma-70 factor (ECF subfamily)
MALRQASNGTRQTKLSSDERELVLAFQSGDPESFQEIHERYRLVIQRLCRRVLGNYHDAEEATQETFLRVYVALERFNGRYALRAWIARIATNVCLDMLRSSSRARVHDNGHGENNGDTPDLNGTHDPEEVFERGAESRRVRAILEQLPEHYRAALVLRAFEGLSHEEMGGILGLTASQVKALLHRAKRAFRQASRASSRRAFSTFALAPIALFSWFRRLFEGDLDARTMADGARVAAGAPAASSVVVSAATATASPAVTTTAAVGGERVMAVVAAVTVAATAAVAPAAHHERADHRPSARPQPVVLQTTSSAPALPTAVGANVLARPEREPRGVVAASALWAPEATPSASPSPQVSPSPTTTASPSPSGGPSPSSSPSSAGAPASGPPAAPVGFTFAFSSDTTASDYCGCGGNAWIDEDVSEVSETGVGSFSTSIVDAAISDSTGQEAWAAEIRQTGRGNYHEFEVVITTEYGTSRYQASGSYSHRTKEKWGGWTYVFQGTYEAISWPPEQTNIPLRGAYTAELMFSWQENRLVEAAFSWQES